ncbi:interleukin-10 receptor subunit alpha-like [Zootoca vivipara]|uniref:interleukin-10 receptor subunit alpha-like n=1 Tax=Zootoca vivipara TaxID=8524 RepID=UPI00159047DD|nr:interleukin-10 receptor subunit alpha-like [Zootoca vivipara]XP_034994905.1 interleukin-10 receptor subunit alpha-like [Zootoca vivipara]XP_034994906.1 interleukin-10 receptor subunit alpha-like [Zootoca vivipara]
MLLAALLLLLLRCLRGHGGKIPAPPERVRFVAETFQHELRWEPPSTERGLLLYDVQYMRYGENGGWSPALNCTRVRRHSCDLSYETREPSGFYFARVRTVTGMRASNWTQTHRFDPRTATPRLAGVSLSLSHNVIQVKLQPPTSRWHNITYEDLYHSEEYHVHIRTVSDNIQFEYVETKLEFNLPSLSWGECYCISVETRVVSQPSPGKRTEEQCISIPTKEDHVRSILISSLALLTVIILCGLGVGVACAYVRKPKEAPLLLKSPVKHSLHWVPKEKPPLGMQDLVSCLEVDAIQPLSSMGPKDPVHPDSTKCGMGAAPAPLGGCFRLPTRLTQGAVLRDLMDSSSCSTDSGICLQDPSGSLGRLSLGSSEEGGTKEDEMGALSRQEQLLLEAPSSSSGAEQVAPEAEDPPKAQIFSGYQNQSGTPSEILGCSQPPFSIDEMTPSEPVLATGYLKQVSISAPSGLARDGTLTNDFLGRTEQQKQPFPASTPLEQQGLPPEFPKTLLALGFFEQELASPSSHISPQVNSVPQLSLGVPGLLQYWVQGLPPNKLSQWEIAQL